MSAWSTANDDVFAAVQRLCYMGLETEGLHRAVIARVREAVPFDGYCAHDIDPASWLPVRQYLDAPDYGQGTDLIELLVFHDDVNDFRTLAASPRKVGLLSEATGGDLDRSMRYRELLRPCGFGFDLRCAYADRRQPWGGISVFRERGSPDFSAADVALLSRLAPHIAAGLRSAALRTAVPAETAPNGPGVLVIDHDGRVSHFTSEAERWLRDLDDLDPAWREGGRLPVVILAAIAALHRTLHPVTERDLAFSPEVRARTRDGVWLQLRASLAQPVDGHEGDTIVVMEPLGPRAVTWLRANAHGLTPREMEVVDLVARGASTRRMADVLFISDYTVQDHLKRIFEKTGVRSRRELVQRLYLEAV